MKLISNSDLLIAHNLAFDIKFIPKSVFKSTTKGFCTMRHSSRFDSSYKGHSLTKVAQTYEVDDFTTLDGNIFSITHNADLLHSSIFDSYICLNIYNKMKKQYSLDFKLEDPNSTSNYKKNLSHNFILVNGDWFYLKSSNK